MTGLISVNKLHLMLARGDLEISDVGAANLSAVHVDECTWRD